MYIRFESNPGNKAFSLYVALAQRTHTSCTSPVPMLSNSNPRQNKTQIIMFKKQKDIDFTS